MDVNASVQEYLNSLTVSRNTIMHYKSALTKLTVYLAKQGIDDVTPDDIGRFWRYLTERKYKSGTIQRTISICRAWFEWAYPETISETKPRKRESSKVLCACGAEKVRAKGGRMVCPECKSLNKFKPRANEGLNRRRPKKPGIKQVDCEQCKTCEYRTYHAPWDAGMYCDYQNITGQFKISIEGYQSPPNCTVYKRRSKKSE